MTKTCLTVFTKEINYNFILMLLVLHRVFHWVVRTCPISRKSFVLRVANLFEAIIACQMNSIEYGVMLDLNLKGYTFFDTHCRHALRGCWASADGHEFCTGVRGHPSPEKFWNLETPKLLFSAFWGCILNHSEYYKKVNVWHFYSLCACLSTYILTQTTVWKLKFTNIHSNP